MNLQEEIELQAKEYASTGLDVNEILQKLEAAFNIVPDYRGNPSNGLSTQRVFEIVVKAVQQTVAPSAPVQIGPNGHASQTEVTQATETQTGALIQPDVNGEFPTPLDGALWMASLGIPQTPLNGKKPRLTDWPTKASTDPKQIRLWAEQYHCNFGSVAVAGHHFIFEADNPAVRERFKQQGHDFTAQLIIESSPGKGHRYYLAAPGVENIGQNAVKHGDFSIRADDEQCVSPGSIHPTTKRQYRVAVNGSLTQPTAEEILFWKSEKKSELTKKTGHVELDDESPIAEGSRNSALTSILGKARQVLGMDAEQLYQYGLSVNQKRCQPPLPDSEVQTIAGSIAKYEIKPGAFPLTQQAQNQQAATQPLPEIDTSGATPRPTFPYWALEGTSLYEGLVKPAMTSSSKHAEFIMMPAIQIMMNHLSGRVSFGQRTIFNINVGLISPYGKYFKSSSCNLAFNYFKVVGLLKTYNKGGMKDKPDETIIMQAGSSEGFGLSMFNIHGTHAILFNDELGKLVSKASIESSSFTHDILSWYESYEFGNTTIGGGGKNNFNFAAGSYAFSWLWATTDRGFNRHWPKLADMENGLVDRMFFVISPEKPKPTGPYYDPPLLIAAEQTAKLIGKATRQAHYDFEDFKSYADQVAGMDPRSMSLVNALAFYFCVDLGASAVDADHIERAKALVAYRDQATQFLAPIEADNRQGRLQKEIIRELRQHGGKMRYRDLCLNLDYSRYGRDVWNRAYDTMLPDGRHEGIICEFPEQTTPGKRPTRMVGLLKFE